MIAAMSSPTARLVAFFETLTPATLPALASVYSDDARFVDPFNDVTGLPAIRAVFDHMFATLDEPRFEVIEAVTEGEQCFLVWNFTFAAADVALSDRFMAPATCASLPTAA